MRTFQNFITEAKVRGNSSDQSLDDYRMSKATDTPLEVGRVRDARKKKSGYLAKQQVGQKKRTKAVGGGKTVPAKDYKKRSDAGTTKPRSKVQQQPTRERGSAVLSSKEAQRKAYKERKAREASGKSKTDVIKTRDKLLSKKKDTTSPNYKPQKASGYTRPERRKLQRAGDRLLKDIAKKKEKPAQHYNPKL